MRLAYAFQWARLGRQSFVASSCRLQQLLTFQFCARLAATKFKLICILNESQPPQNSPHPNRNSSELVGFVLRCAHLLRRPAQHNATQRSRRAPMIQFLRPTSVPSRVANLFIRLAVYADYANWAPLDLGCTCCDCCRVQSIDQSGPVRALSGTQITTAERGRKRGPRPAQPRLPAASDTLRPASKAPLTTPSRLGSCPSFEISISQFSFFIGRLFYEPRCLRPTHRMSSSRRVDSVSFARHASR